MSGMIASTPVASRPRHALWLLLLIAVAGLLTACSTRATPAPTPSPQARPSVAWPETISEIVIQPEEGGQVALNNGAQVTLPPHALTTRTTVRLQAITNAPSVPSPRSIIGKAYEFDLAEGDLIGVATIRLPLPAGLQLDQYDVAGYRWNGRSWERVGGRLAGNSIQFGADTPGLFAVQAQWRLADVTLALALPQTDPGQLQTPIVVVGQYRYLALAAERGEYLRGHLRLKRDSSGGAGQITGDDALDQTIAETTLFFQPDPARPQGVIEFSHVFAITPAQSGLAAGATGRFYATITVEDALAPTRGQSPTIEYTQMLPIRIVGREVVRPALAIEGTPPLRWNVLLDGDILVQPSAAGLTLSVDSLLAEGGLGRYRIIVEAQTEAGWRPISNEVTIELRLPVTPTPLPTATPTAGGTPVFIPGATTGLGTPTATPPATPTRRPTAGGPTATPTQSPTLPPPTATPVSGRPAWANLFWADRYVLAPGECTNLHWRAENVISVYFNGTPATGVEDRQVCPSQTTTYNLRITSTTGTIERNLQIVVETAVQAAIEFTADDNIIQPGECTLLRWRVKNVSAVYLDDEGVAGEDVRGVCMEETTIYELKVVDLAGRTTVRWLTVYVKEEEEIEAHFWAEQYTLSPGQCTNLNWWVQDVREVYLEITGPREGVAGVGSRRVCPIERQFYTLTAIALDGRTTTRRVTLTAVKPALGAQEVIAQGIVQAVTGLPDLDPNTAGEQPGWAVLIDGINPLFVGAAGWTQAVVTLQVTLDQTDVVLADEVSWPLTPGQLIEFRATCSGNTCTMPESTPFYMLLRSGPFSP